MRDVGLLTSFVEAADCGSFTEAARRLMLTPSTVSRNIARLEGELGTRLFHRTTRVLLLTEEGRLYRDSVRSAFNLLEESESQLTSAGSEPKGVLRVAMPGPFSATYILPRLRTFLEAHERISLDITFADTPVDPVRHGHDLVIRNGAPADGSNVIRKLCEEEQVLVASPDYLDRHGAPSSPDDLANHLCIAHKGDGSQTLQWLLRPTEGVIGDDRRSLLYDPHTRLRVFGHSHGGVDAALSGLGIAAASLVHVRRLISAGQLKMVLPGFRFVDETGLSRIYAVYPDRKFLPVKVRLFLEFIASAIQEEASWALEAAR